MSLIKLLSLITVFIFSISSHAKEKILLVADYWCPYNCYPNTDYEGLLVDIARIAMAKNNIDIDYKMESWAKAVDDFNNSRVDGIIGASPGDVLNPIFPSLAITKSYFSAHTINNFKWKYHDTNSLNKMVLGIVEGYTYSDDIKNYVYSTYIEKPEQFYISSSLNPIDDNITKLLQGDITVYVEDDNVIRDFANAKKISSLKNSGSVQNPIELYIAFPSSKPNSVKYARMITDTYLELKANGKLHELAKKYKINKL
jgi:polar amino acid transport system substrate-binding protein